MDKQFELTHHAEYGREAIDVDATRNGITRTYDDVSQGVISMLNQLMRKCQTVVDLDDSGFFVTIIGRQR